MTRKAVCLLSGGLDSATTLAQAKSDGYEIISLTIDYGQLHKREIQSAEKIASFFKVQNFMIQLPMPWGGSALLDPDIQLPKKRHENEMAAQIPVTYVPARNTIFLSLAASLAESQSAEAIFIGANAIDYSGYPDCRPEYFTALEEALRRGTKCGTEGRQIAIKAPLLRLKKSEIIKLGKSLGVPYELTWSCYQGGEVPCGECDSCQIRAKGFNEANTIDPILNVNANSIS